MMYLCQIIIVFSISLAFHIQATEEGSTESPHRGYSVKVTEYLHSLADSNVDLSQCKLAPRQEQILQTKKDEKEKYSLAADYCYQNHNPQLAAQLYAKSSLLGNTNALFELAKSLSDTAEIKKLLIEEAAKKNCYRAKVYLGQIKEAY